MITTDSIPAEPSNHSRFKSLLSKVPEVTLFFWIIKVLCTTIGETAADFLNVNLNLGLTITSIIMGGLLAIALFIQFKTRKYTPVVYWITVMLISVFGTLVTDNMSDNLHVPLEYSTIFFTIMLALTFGIWYAVEKTLSIHSIFTRRREAFYWLAILFTFALGTASGDLMSEGLGLGYLTTGVIIAAVIAVFAIGWRVGIHSILSFWIIYIMTRPLGASIGDLLTQSPANGGIGLGPTLTTVVFTAAIIFSVTFLTLSQHDVVKNTEKEESEDKKNSKYGVLQTGIVVALLLLISIGGYHWRHQQLQNEAVKTAKPNAPGAPATPLGDVSNLASLTQAMLTAVQAGDFVTANSRANDIETAWDTSQARLKPMNLSAWTHVDGAIDKVLREVRAVHPNQQTTTKALQTLIAALKNP